MANASELEDRIVTAIRRIVRAIDLQSRRLMDECGLSGPQLAVLREAERLKEAPTGSVARGVHLSQPTVSGILDRLERQGFVRRTRSPDDRRAVLVKVTPGGAKVLRKAPSLLQDRFLEQLARLEEWERLWVLAALERVGTMMDAEAIPAAPVFETGSMPSAPVEEAGKWYREATSLPLTAPARHPRRKQC